MPGRDVQTDEWRLQNASEKITYLRVDNLDSHYGPQNDRIDAEVIIKLNIHPDRAFGFQLRPDDYCPSYQGMLQLLLAAYKNDWNVGIAYWRLWKFTSPEGWDTTRKNHRLFRVWLEK